MSKFLARDELGVCLDLFAAFVTGASVERKPEPVDIVVPAAAGGKAAPNPAAAKKQGAAVAASTAGKPAPESAGKEAASQKPTVAATAAPPAGKPAPVAFPEAPRRRLPPLGAEPVLPVAGQRNILVTSALPYVNVSSAFGHLAALSLHALAAHSTERTAFGQPYRLRAQRRRVRALLPATRAQLRVHLRDGRVRHCDRSQGDGGGCSECC